MAGTARCPSSPGVAAALLWAGGHRGHRGHSGPRPRSPPSSGFLTVLRQSPLNITTCLLCFSFLMLCICGGESYRANSKYFVQSTWTCQDFFKKFPFFYFFFCQHYLILKKIICRKKKKNLSFKKSANSETLEEKELATVSLKPCQDQSCMFLQKLCK